MVEQYFSTSFYLSRVLHCPDTTSRSVAPMVQVVTTGFQGGRGVPRKWVGWGLGDEVKSSLQPAFSLQLLALLKFLSFQSFLRDFFGGGGWLVPGIHASFSILGSKSAALACQVGRKQGHCGLWIFSLSLKFQFYFIFLISVLLRYN